jgi:pyruvate/2-oxoglutarate dehydrogenase complex dihydrolipoamide acyltransferase (E2) component
MDDAADRGLQQQCLGAGAVVQPDEVLALIETDKVTIDVRYTGSKPGVLNSISLAADDVVTVGQAVAVVDDDEATVEAAGGAGVAPAAGKKVHQILTSLLASAARMSAVAQQGLRCAAGA